MGTNDGAVAYYLAGGWAPSTKLVAAALAWRTVPLTDEEAAAELLREQIMPLCVHYVDDHVARLASLDRPELARAFDEWRDRLVR